jgi:hypothetical protein
MSDDKKTAVLRARVGEKLKRDFQRYCKGLSKIDPNATEANLLRSAIREFMESHPVDKAKAA